MFRPSLLAGTGLVLTASIVSAATHIVDPGGGGDFTTIADAVAAAAAGDEIELVDATYSGDGNRLIDVTVDLEIRSQSGDAESCVIDLSGTTVETHAFQVLGGTTRIEGIAFVDANSQVFTDKAAAIQVDGGSLEVLGCHFLRNRSQFVSGIYVTAGALLIEGCRFEDNEAASTTVSVLEGTVDVRGTIFRNNPNSLAVLSATLTIGPGLVSDCVFEGNESLNGAVHVVRSELDVLDSRFVGNHAASGGAVAHVSPGATGLIQGCWFEDNTAQFDGGAILVADTEAGVTIDGCVFLGNGAGQDGGAIYFLRASGLVTSSTIARSTCGPLNGAVSVRSGGVLAVDRTIVAFTLGGYGLYADGSGMLDLSCTDSFGNEGGDWEVFFVSGQLGVDGNFAADPRFCDLEVGDLSLFEASPCLPGQHPDGAACDLIGALDVDCVVTPTAPTTWGYLKSRFGPADGPGE